MSNRQFHRSFIILKAQDSGYNLHSGKEPAGYVKMEIKNNQGKIQLYIQDMKPAEPQQAIYDVILVSNREEVEPIKLTSIQVPDNGRGEYEITFDPTDVGETKYSIGEYHALAVVERQLKNNHALRYPLVGYSDKRVVLDWTNEVTRRLMHMYHASRSSNARNLFSSETKEEENSTVEEEADQSNDSELQEEETDEIIEEQQRESLEEEGIHPDILNYQPPDISYIYQNQDGLDEEILHDPPFDQIQSSPGTTADQDNEEPYHSENPNVEAEDFYSMQLGSASYWSKVEEYYSRLFDNHKKVTPFDDANGEVDWIRVENRNEPIYSQYRAYDPYHPYRRNGGGLDHYLIGLVRNQGKVQYVVYGIPGIYSAAPPMSMHGFSRWLPVKNGYGAGYWLLYIDAVTGNIAYPY